jgi:hypothetical protein
MIFEIILLWNFESLTCQCHTFLLRKFGKPLLRGTKRKFCTYISFCVGIAENGKWVNFQEILTWEKSGTTRGCRLWDVKNSGSLTEVKRTFIHQNLSIFMTKSL